MSDYRGVARIFPPRNYLGTAADIAAGMSYLRGSKRKHSAMTSSSNIAHISNAAKKNVTQNLMTGSELIDRKRSGKASYRLHAAKYLQMDKMLKSMFFPMCNQILKFGISSFSGAGDFNFQDKVAPSISTSLAEYQRPRGLYRGFCMFDVRTTLSTANRTSDIALNCDPVVVGEIEDGPATFNVDSYYRRFHNQPVKQKPGGISGDGAKVTQDGPQTLVTTDTDNLDHIRSLTMGVNLAQMEQQAALSMVYQDPIMSNWLANGNQTTVGFVGKNFGAQPTASRVRDDGSLEGTSMSNVLLGSTGSYLNAVQDGVMRICDGKLKLDIMNTESTPSVVEVVIHTKKKSLMTKDEIYQQLYRDVDRKMKRRVFNGGGLASDANTSGGWQAFYDPTYPFLSTDSDAVCRRYVNESHRSVHILAPGQSKVVEISLGSLWYKLGNKTDTLTAPFNEGNSSEFLQTQFNTGSLFVNIGHSGFEYPQSIVNSTANIDKAYLDPSTMQTASSKWGNVAGAGFWVGKANAPSSISIDGVYTEKFYPLTFDRSGFSAASHGVARPAYIDGEADYDVAIPINTIVPERVQTTPADGVQAI